MWYYKTHSQQETPLVKREKAVVLSQSLNLRSTPTSTKDNVVVKMNLGDVLEIETLTADESNLNPDATNWVKVYYQDTNGYVHKDYVCSEEEYKAIQDVFNFSDVQANIHPNFKRAIKNYFVQQKWVGTYFFSKQKERYKQMLSSVDFDGDKKPFAGKSGFSKAGKISRGGRRGG